MCSLSKKAGNETRAWVALFLAASPPCPFFHLWCTHLHRQQLAFTRLPHPHSLPDGSLATVSSATPTTTPSSLCQKRSTTKTTRRPTRSSANTLGTSIVAPQALQRRLCTWWCSHKYSTGSVTDAHFQSRCPAPGSHWWAHSAGLTNLIQVSSTAPTVPRPTASPTMTPSGPTSARVLQRRARCPARRPVPRASRLRTTATSSTSTRRPSA